jgi:hypothetical protein
VSQHRGAAPRIHSRAGNAPAPATRPWVVACETASTPNNCGKKHSPCRLTNFDTSFDIQPGARRRLGGARQPGCGC